MTNDPQPLAVTISLNPADFNALRVYAVHQGFLSIEDYLLSLVREGRRLAEHAPEFRAPEQRALLGLPPLPERNGNVVPLKRA
jgi:hypothetical protein